MAKSTFFINNQLAHAHLLLVQICIIIILTCLFDAVADALSGYM